MDRRCFIKQAGAGIVAVGLSGCASDIQAQPSSLTNGSRPNVVLVMTDDQGYGDLAAHGNRHIRTPHLDRLWAACVRLTDFHVDPTCAPTRAALLTGRYSSRTGIWHTIMGRSLLHSDEVTMADMFKAAGYTTGIFGKWHLGDNYPFRPQDRGFDEVLIHGGGGVTQLPDYWGNDYFDDTYWHNGKARSYTGYCTDVWFDGAIQFIEANRDRPFFCYIPTNAPHSPYYVPEKYADPYRDAPEVPNANFYGMITNIDDNMAWLRIRLKKLGLEQNTILIFMTDNGTAAGFSKGKGFNDRMRGTKGSQYDGGHRVPCFIHWPDGGLVGGCDMDALCGHIDLLPTLAELCHIKTPVAELDGISLVPLLRGKTTERLQRTLVVHSQRIEWPQKWRTCAVMTERWRLIDGKELYDIRQDPSQTKNIAGDHPKTVETLRCAYERWWKSVSDRFDGYCEIVLGSEQENPSRLTSHDWHTNDGPVPWNQDAVRSAMKANGFWAVRIARDGIYRLELRRWPREADLPIQAVAEGAKAVMAVRARIQIAGVDQTKDITGPEKGIVFTATLPAGSTKLQTWFIEPDGSSRGAYFVYVERMQG
ncbi:MAG: arylsulfatase [Sedimentisphaerales bacterium]|nr:arylsulfatase [Sedimentisphaerales bacterium]